MDCIDLTCDTPAPNVQTRVDSNQQIISLLDDTDDDKQQIYQNKKPDEDIPLENQDQQVFKNLGYNDDIKTQEFGEKKMKSDEVEESKRKKINIEKADFEYTDGDDDLLFNYGICKNDTSKNNSKINNFQNKNQIENIFSSSQPVNLTENLIHNEKYTSFSSQNQIKIKGSFDDGLDENIYSKLGEKCNNNFYSQDQPKIFSSQPVFPLENQFSTKIPEKSDFPSSDDEINFIAKRRRRSSMDQKRLEKEEKSRKKQLEKQQKEQEKLRLKQQRENERLEKKLQKQKEQDRIRIQREVERRSKGNTSLQFITTIVEKKFSEDPLGVEIINKLKSSNQTTLKQSLEVQIQNNLPMSPYPVIMWKKKLLKQQISLDPQDGLDEVEITVKLILICFKGKDFLDLVLHENKFQDLMNEVQQKHEGFCFMMLVENLEKEIKKLDNASLRGQMAESNSGSQFGGGEKSSRDRVGDFVCEKLVNYPGIKFREIDNVIQGAEHVHALTVAIARQPYYRNETVIHNFQGGKMSEGKRQVEGEIAEFPQGQKAWAKALYMIEGVKPKEVIAIAKEYKSMAALMTKYRDPSLDEQQKSLLLQDLSLDSGRRLGPAVSKRIYKVLCTEDGSIAVRE